MNRSYLGNSIMYHLGKHQWTQLSLANKINLAQSSLSQIMSRPKRPETTTLRALCNCWPDADSNLRVLIEHLRDEMVRAGHAAEGEIEFRPTLPAANKLEAAIALVAQEAAVDRDVGALIMDLAHLIRRAHHIEYPLPDEHKQIAADRPHKKS